MDERGAEASTRALAVQGLRLSVRQSRGGYRWQVVAGNGRAVGSATVTAQSTATATADFWSFVCRGGALTATVRHRGGGRGWTWLAVQHDGSPVAESLSYYERHGTCERAAQRFLSVVTALRGRLDPDAPTLAG